MFHGWTPSKGGETRPSNPALDSSDRRSANASRRESAPAELRIDAEAISVVHLSTLCCRAPKDRHHFLGHQPRPWPPRPRGGLTVTSWRHSRTVVQATKWPQQNFAVALGPRWLAAYASSHECPSHPRLEHRAPALQLQRAGPAAPAQRRDAGRPGRRTLPRRCRQAREPTGLLAAAPGQHRSRPAAPRARAALSGDRP